MVQSVLAVGMIVCLCIWGIDKIKVSLSALNNKSGLELTENDDGLAFRKFIYVIVYIIHVVCFSNTGEAFAE